MIFSLDETFENLCDVCLTMHIAALKLKFGEMKLLRPSSNGSVNFVITHFSFPLYEGYILDFFSSNFSSSIFHLHELWGRTFCTYESI